MVNLRVATATCVWILGLVACKQGATANLVSNGIELQAEFTGTDIVRDHGVDKTLLYGVLTGNIPADKIINLTCVVVASNDVHSEQIYVDSVAHVLPDRYRVSSSNPRIRVYWKLPKVIALEPGNLNIRLEIQNGCSWIPSD